MWYRGETHSCVRYTAASSDGLEADCCGCCCLCFCFSARRGISAATGTEVACGCDSMSSSRSMSICESVALLTQNKNCQEIYSYRIHSARKERSEHLLFSLRTGKGPSATEKHKTFLPPSIRSLLLLHSNRKRTPILHSRQGHGATTASKAGVRGIRAHKLPAGLPRPRCRR